MMVKVEPAMVRDLGTILQIEVQTQEYPLPQEAIQCYFDNPEHLAYVASVGNRKVGHSLVHVQSEYTVINRVSVHPNFRNIGVGKALMHRVEADAWKKKQRFLRMYLPSYKIDDKSDPDYMGWWMAQNHLKCVKCETDSYFRYGKWWDAYVFERMI